VPLDWVMLANSLTILRHDPELLRFLGELVSAGVGVINSALFHAGFLAGGRFFDYRETSRDNPADEPLFAWRDAFFTLCLEHAVDPATACVQFALSAPGVVAVAMNTSKPEHVAKNAAAVETEIPNEFWQAAKDRDLISVDYLYL
jgi:D-threo-aldose 1-dehydrogenase